MTRPESAEPEPVAGKKNILVYCDESGMHGSPYYGFGSLWITYERRGDLTGWVNDLRGRHRMNDEVKWSKVNARYLPFYRDLVTGFFETHTMMFHCIVVRKGYVDRSFHARGIEEAMQKHLTMFLEKKIEHFAAGRDGRCYRVRVDKLPFSYSKSHEVIANIGNALLRRSASSSVIHDVLERDSKETTGIQVADVLLGAVMSARNRDATSAAKLALQAHTSELLGWKDLDADTYPEEWKFNIWSFRGRDDRRKRETTTRLTQLRHPMPRFVRPGPASR